MPPATVRNEVVALRRSVATALYLAGVGALARVRAGVHHEGAALRRSVATALLLAGVGALARVRAAMPLEISAHS